MNRIVGGLNGVYDKRYLFMIACMLITMYHHTIVYTLYTVILTHGHVDEYVFSGVDIHYCH